MLPTHYPLSALLTHLKQTVAANYPNALWVTAEIQSIGIARGHRYLKLIEQSSPTPTQGETPDGVASGGNSVPNSDIIAQADAALWQATYNRLQKKLGTTLDDVLRDGQRVLICVQIIIHERYGLQLRVDDIDPAYTFGQAAMIRQKTIAQLTEEGLLVTNKRFAMPSLPLRVAVVAAESSAGYADFSTQLLYNPHGFPLSLTLFNTTVQGENAVREVVAALATIAAIQTDADDATRFDVVCILRGGGSRLDLMAFDDYEVAAAAARMPLLVLSGIGHETDSVVLDLVAHTALKTPTAVAEHLLERLRLSAAHWNKVHQRVVRATTQHFSREATRLKRLQPRLQNAAKRYIERKRQLPAHLAERLERASASYYRTKHEHLTRLEHTLVLLHPQRVLERGYSLTMQNGSVVQRATDLDPNTPLTTRLADGATVVSTVISS